MEQSELNYSLYDACCRGHISMAKVLIAMGANIDAFIVNRQIPDTVTASHICIDAAVSANNLELVELLLENSACIDYLKIASRYQVAFHTVPGSKGDAMRALLWKYIKKRRRKK